MELISARTSPGGAIPRFDKGIERDAEVASPSGGAGAAAVASGNVPDDATVADGPVPLAKRIRVLARRADEHCRHFIEPFVRFDETKGWTSTGAKNGPARAQAEIGIGHDLAKDQLRVGRKLRELPELSRLFEGRTGARHRSSSS